MFGKFLQSKSCMRLLSWVLDHQEGDYPASIVHLECGNPAMGDFMASITILQGVDIIRIDEMSEDLIISFNPDSSSSQLISHFKDEFNDLAFRNMNVSPALSYLSSPSFKNQIDLEVLGDTQNIDLSQLLDFCKDFESREITNEFEQDVYNLCSEMKDTGVYDDFIKFFETKINDEK